MIAEAQKDDIIRVVREILAEKDNHAILFDPILVEADVDHDGDEYLEITIVYEGDLDALDTKWKVSLIRRFESRLMQAGINEFAYLGRRFVEKSEWEALQENRYFDEDLFA